MANNVLKYKDFYGVVEYSPIKDCFCGKIKGIKEAVDFEGDSVSSLKKAFYEAVDKYIIECEKKGKETKKSYKGSFNVRISPELHQNAASAAVQKNISLNSFVEKAIHREVYEKIQKIDSKKEKRIMIYTYVKENYKFTENDKKEALGMYQQIIKIAHTVRRNGLLSIDDKISDYENPFLRRAMQLAVDSTEPQIIEDILDRYIILGEYTSKEMLELLLIKKGTLTIVDGYNPFMIKEELLPFFGIEFSDEMDAIYQNIINEMIDEYWQNIKNGKKYVVVEEFNLLEDKFNGLSDDDMQALCRNVDDKDLKLAVYGSSAAVCNKILNNISYRVAHSIIQSILFGNLFGSDWARWKEIIIEAQNRILAKIDELIEK
jgi:predicted HicB family RNase H-like nuclease